MERPSPRPGHPGRVDLGAPGGSGGRGGPAVPDRASAGSWGGRLERWAAEARVDHAARARTRERWLLRQAEEEGSLAGVLADLCDHASTVRVGLRGGHVVVGTVRAVGADLVAVSSPVQAAGLAVVALPAVTAVRTTPGERPVAGDREVASSLRLDDVLAELAAEREPVRLLTVDGETAGGRLRALGRDVLTLTGPPGDEVATVYVPRPALAAVLVDG